MKGIFVALFTLAVFSGTVLADTIYTEGFEGGVMPTDWQVWQEGPSSTTQWRFDQTSMPYTGTYYMFHGYDSSNDLDNWVVTQTFDMTTWENLEISFWHCGAFPTYYTYTALMVSTTENPAAADFSELFEMGAPPSSYTQAIVDASAYDYEEFVTFAWRYTGLDGHTERIDDILLTGDVVIPGIKAASLGTIKAVYK